MSRFLKFLAALVLLPALWSSLRFAAHLVSQMDTGRLPWHLAVPFLAGLAGAVVMYLFHLRPTWMYVFGHESTHALAVWMSGGRVSSFRVHASGGEVVSDRMSLWIALSPYLLPFYPLLAALLWLLLTWLWPAAGNHVWAFLALWGLSWGYHFCFTASLLKTRQPDFATQGLFFSLVLVCLVNLWLVIALLWLGLAPVPLLEGLARFRENLLADYAGLGKLLLTGLRKCLDLLSLTG